ncbi:hypothetical protein Zmor_013351 [Zophobas morio]|uniref:Uncharacterized protein n=1 Tax=Zophobas morio TaxID=2755281 RepID=A0AA38MEJ4_9CUCU|nr:hypothetical protein Zmor_013351 [Zophobas morio]
MINQKFGKPTQRWRLKNPTNTREEICFDELITWKLPEGVPRPDRSNWCHRIKVRSSHTILKNFFFIFLLTMVIIFGNIDVLPWVHKFVKRQH